MPPPHHWAKQIVKLATSPPNPTFEIMLLVLLAFLWGGSFTLIKIAVETVPPASIAAARVTTAAILLLLLARWRGERLPRGIGIWSALFVQGFLQSALPFTLIGWGEQHIDSALAGVLNATPPLFVFLITFATIKREGNLGRKLLGVATGLAGVVLMIGVDSLGGLGADVMGQLAVLGASVSYALAAIFARRFAGLGTITTAGSAMLTAAAIMVPVAFLFDRPWTLAPSETSLFAVAALAVFSTALAMMIYFRLLRTLGPLGTASGGYLRAGFSVILGMVVLSEPVSLALAVGLALILAGVAILNGQIRLPLGRSRDPL